MKKLLVFVLVLAMVLSMAACGKSDEGSTGGDEKSDVKTTEESNNDSGSETDTSAGDETVLRMLLSDDSLEGGAFHQLAEMYKEETGVTVEIIEVPYADLQTKLKNMIRAGNAPNIVRTTGIAEFKEFFLELDDVIDRDSIIDAKLNDVLNDGKVVGVPSNVTANGMFYNKSVFEQAGIEAPTSADDLWTWEEFVASVKEVVANSDADYGLVWDHSQHRYATMLYQFGGSFYSEDHSTVKIANENGVESLNFFLSLFEDEFMPKSVWVGTEDPSSMFKTGKVAVHMAGNWKIPDYTENINDFEWGAVLMPYATNRSSVIGGNFVIGVKDTGLEAETKEFIKWFHSDEIYTKYCEIGSYLPGKKNINPSYESEALSIFVDELNNTPAVAGTDWAPFPEYPGVSWGNALRDNIDLAIVGDLTAEEALQATEAAILEAYTELEVER